MNSSKESLVPSFFLIFLVLFLFDAFVYRKGKNGSSIVLIEKIINS